MTTPVPPDRPGNARLKAATAVLVAAVAAYAALHAGAPPPAATDGCPAGTQLVVMRAADTARAVIVGDTLFVQRTDTLLRVDETTHQAFAIVIDSGAQVQLAAVCAPVSPTFRLRVVPTLPTEAPPPAQVASSVRVPP